SIEIKIPTGIRTLGSLVGLTKADDYLIATIPSLAVGESITYKYNGMVVQTGVISTVASIIALNQIDAIKSNNTSTFNVECLTCQEVCIGTSLNAKTEEQQ